MIQYNTSILEMWNKEDISLLSPLLMPNSIKIHETLVVGLNPSNSYESLKSVKNKFKNEWLNDKIISKLYDSKSYNEFLDFRNFKNNQKSIWKIQEWCHTSHRHFIKQNKFLFGVGIKKFTFIDLFPIWCISQNQFIIYINNNYDLAHQLVAHFIDMIELNNIEKLIFLNKESFNQFKKFSSNHFSIKNIQAIDVGKARMKHIEKGFLQLKTKKIIVYSIGIGGWENNDVLIEKLLKEKYFI